MKADFLLRGVGRLVTMDGHLGESQLGVIKQGAVLARDGRVVWAGRESEIPSAEGELQEFDAGGRAVLPGLVDSHTHLLFAGDRAPEFAARMRGEQYSGAGIATTVRATRQADDDELISLAGDRLDRFLGFGVTTVEAKSGYGLNVIDEVRLVELAADLKHPVRIVPTLLAAHVVPPEFEGNADGYVDLVCRDILPAAARARFCDVWCEDGAFTVEQSRRILRAAAAQGMKLKVHADQLSHSGGAALAAEVGAVSADHLEFADGDDAGALARANVIAVLLPGAALMTRGPKPPARALLEAGVRVAISTDFNPGSSYSENLELMVALACAELGLTVEEAILGVTRHAAAALDMESEVGSLAPGHVCDALVLQSESELDLAYHYGVNLTHSVIRAGHHVAPPMEGIDPV